MVTFFPFFENAKIYSFSRVQAYDTELFNVVTMLYIIASEFIHLMI